MGESVVDSRWRNLSGNHTKEWKPYEIRKRTILFARDVLKADPSDIRQHPPSLEVWRQLVRAAGSVGANLEEANAASAPSDFTYRVKVALREAREAFYWLRLIRAGDLRGSSQSKALHDEARRTRRHSLRVIAKKAAASGRNKKQPAGEFRPCMSTAAAF